jgi:hypothetical protein
MPDSIELSHDVKTKTSRCCIWSTQENYNKNNNICSTNSNIFDIDTLNYNKNKSDYNKNNYIYEMNTLNYKKNNSNYNIENYIF